MELLNEGNDGAGSGVPIRLICWLYILLYLNKKHCSAHCKPGWYATEIVGYLPR